MIIEKWPQQSETKIKQNFTFSIYILIFKILIPCTYV